MTTTDSVEHTRRLAAAALAAMSRLGIAPTPNNFLIWYNDCSGGCLELSRRLRHLESGGEVFTEELLAELYEAFFGTGREVVRLLNETCARIETAMAHLRSQVAGMTRDAGSYGAKLASFGEALRGYDQSGELHALVGAILEETRRMQRQAQQLEVQLQESSARVEDLRAELTSAQREASTDSLTGIANRKHFDHALRLAAEEALASARPLCLLLADIDHFKQFNDTYGHQVGDQVLRLVGQVLTQSVKGRDLPARYGGEEFAVILPQTDLEGACKLAEQIRMTMASNRIRAKSSGRDLGGISTSIGCAQYMRGEPLTAFIHRADEALYRAKRAGRNRVAVEQAESSPAGLTRWTGPEAAAPSLTRAG